MKRYRLTKVVFQAREPDPDTPVIDGPMVAVEVMRAHLAREGDECERFCALGLDARGKPVAFQQVGQGTLTACLVHPREFFAPMLVAGGVHSVIALHNHPSGDPDPSLEDHALTDRLVEAGEILGVPVVDHVIVTRRGFRSLVAS